MTKKKPRRRKANVWWALRFVKYMELFPRDNPPFLLKTRAEAVDKAATCGFDQYDAFHAEPVRVSIKVLDP